MRILLTGGSGFVGRPLAAALVSAGHDVRLPLRNPAAAGNLPSAAELISIPPLESMTAQAWRTHLGSIDAVVHAAAVAHVGPEVPEARYMAVNRDASVRLAEAAAAANISRFVFLSSIKAQAGDNAAGIVHDESQPPRPTDPYGVSKLMAERAISAVLPAAVHIRPTLVVGEESKGNLATLLRIADTPWPLPFGGFRAGQAMVVRENLIAAIRLALENSALQGGTYIAAEEPHPSLAEMLTWLREGLGRPPRLVTMPESALRMPLRLMGRAGKLQRLTEGLTVSSARLRAVGWVPDQSPADCFRALGRARKALNQAYKQA
jgi:nucleoside-diphosphate-sugar epimerase